MIEQSEVAFLRDEKPSCCYACNQPLRRFSMLICPECLDSSCEEFEKLAIEDDSDE